MHRKHVYVCHQKTQLFTVLLHENCHEMALYVHVDFSQIVSLIDPPLGAGLFHDPTHNMYSEKLTMKLTLTLTTLRAEG